MMLRMRKLQQSLKNWDIKDHGVCHLDIDSSIITMTLVHIVLVKIKADLSSNDVYLFKDSTHKLGEEQELKPLFEKMVWGPPAYDGRTKGYNWGLYSTFASRADYEKYRDHPVHRSFVDNIIKKYSEDLMAYDIEV